MIEAIIFDVGGVLAYDVWEHLLLDNGDPCNPGSPVGIAALFELRKSDVDRVGRKLWKIYSRPVEELSKGDLEDHYWAAFMEELKGQLPPSVTAADLKARTDLFIKAVDPLGMDALLSDLVAKNLRLVICSDNTEFWFRRQFEKLGLQRFFASEDCFLSSRVGFSKSSQGFEMFRAISQALGIEKSSCLFIDDRRKNVEVALNYGFVPILFPSNSPLGAQYLKALFSQLGI